jgi:hypothetical protein
MFAKCEFQENELLEPVRSTHPAIQSGVIFCTVAVFLLGLNDKIVPVRGLGLFFQSALPY